MGFIESPPDDGKPKTCWLKSHARGFGRIPSGVLTRKRTCNAGREMSGGLCYDKCPQGQGVGPVCWGSCPIGTKSCGVLCQIEGEKCIGMVTKVTKDVISTGVKGVGQDYLGAVKGAMQVGSDLAYPICRDMGGNGLPIYDPWYDERLWYFPPTVKEDEEEYYHHYFGDEDYPY